MEPWDCLDCGHPCEETDSHCPKCEASLHRQTDGSTVTVDIAHAGETIEEAKEKLDGAIRNGFARRTQTLRVITGTGAIRNAMTGWFRTLRARGRIIRFEPDGRNPGAYRLRLR